MGLEFREKVRIGDKYLGIVFREVIIEAVGVHDIIMGEREEKAKDRILQNTFKRLRKQRGRRSSSQRAARHNLVC